ncbi:MAG: hypothetical protein ACNYPH_06020 [Gammaproteobacteria bacterium WSBS_2016_MAG_OTU1]
MAKAKAEAKKTKGVFRFKNIGPIGEAELELGDLTVIAGANNSGKTYLTYTLYGFLKYVNGLVDIDKMDVVKIISLGMALFKSDEPKFDIERYSEEKGILKASMKIDDVKQYINNKIEYICKDFSSVIGNVFASSQETFKEAMLQYEREKIYSLKDEMVSLEVNHSTGKIEITIGKGFDSSFVNIDDRYSEEFVKGIILGIVIGQQLPSPFILSTERPSISLFYKELDFAKSKIIELFQKLDENSFNKDVGNYINIRQGMQSR